MDALLLIALLHSTKLRSTAVSPLNHAVLIASYTPPNRGIPDRRVGAGTR